MEHLKLYSSDNYCNKNITSRPETSIVEVKEKLKNNRSRLVLDNTLGSPAVIIGKLRGGNPEYSGDTSKDVEVLGAVDESSVDPKVVKDVENIVLAARKGALVDLFFSAFDFSGSPVKIHIKDTYNPLDRDCRNLYLVENNAEFVRKPNKGVIQACLKRQFNLPPIDERKITDRLYDACMEYYAISENIRKSHPNDAPFLIDTGLAIFNNAMDNLAAGAMLEVGDLTRKLASANRQLVENNTALSNHLSACDVKVKCLDTQLNSAITEQKKLEESYNSCEESEKNANMLLASCEGRNNMLEKAEKQSSKLAERVTREYTVAKGQLAKYKEKYEAKSRQARIYSNEIKQCKTEVITATAKADEAVRALKDRTSPVKEDPGFLNNLASTIASILDSGVKFAFAITLIAITASIVYWLLFKSNFSAFTGAITSSDRGDGNLPPGPPGPPGPPVYPSQTIELPISKDLGSWIVGAMAVIAFCILHKGAKAMDVERKGGKLLTAEELEKSTKQVVFLDQGSAAPKKNQVNLVSRLFNTMLNGGDNNDDSGGRPRYEKIDI